MDMSFEGGFADPVLDSQATFRAIMDALANPGKPQALGNLVLSQHGLTAELGNVLLALSDADTRIWLSETLRRPEVEGFAAFHTGAPLVTDPERATFAFATSTAELPRLDSFNLGTQEYPDRSTTVVLAVPSLTGGRDLALRGPGIKDHLHCSPTGLPDDFVAQWAANREVFPRGVDLLLVADGQVMGLPRSTRISEGH
ncbi:MAG: phosphonate C-P lyase system protein PhnH [Candidatus Devosia phytovorans]|uniref:Phosphonate C-P lyase system protein PhnH n=1 Tax=Candidatus Devosia phytovorans TaxID=3121372 RepID=A0AAJ5VZR8_9HYPH|nr:phosphonate C-P lyase system protein PhnH [Devosia sp.]WEK06543.1 MAG: phosphonate C-P lyase system protein PhnH [Devosia sp.]